MITHIAGNVGKRELCKLCKEEVETTKHVFHCSKVANEEELKATIKKETLDKILRLERESRD